MISGLLDFFTGGSSSSDKRFLYEDHIVRVVHHDIRNLTYTDCCHWTNHRVVLELKRFERPQLGTIKYIGCDTKGVLCAGIEFDYDIGGMSGKVNGQKLFKCKQNHGLLVPVEFVKLLEDHENGTNIFPVGAPNHFAGSTLSHINRTQSVPNLSSRRADNVALEDYTPDTLSGLTVGDNVVWLGGTDPHTGIVRWIGRAGRNEQIPVKAWMEMDEFIGFGHSEMDIGIRFGCASGRGKFLPVAELILLENFIPGEINEPHVDDVPQILPEFTIPSPATVITDSSVNQDLIDFTPEKIENKETTFADQLFNQIINPEVESRTSVPEPVANDALKSKDLNEAIIKEFSPLTCIVETSIDQIKICEPTNSVPEINGSPIDEFNESAASKIVTVVTSQLDVNGNKQSSENDRVLNKTTSFVEPEVDYLPPFIVPVINIVDFFKAGGLKGIQGRRNSCYIDVVLFSLFAFTDTFDPYFLVKSYYHSKGPDSELTRMAKKILAEQIVNPLRQNYYCPATGVNFLRELMIPVSDKMDGGFMDIEEFMLILFDKIFNLKEFIIYDNGMKDYLHQVNLGDHILPPVMTLKQCLELSMTDYRLKLQEIPYPALIIEIPRNTYGIIQSTTIIPNLSLNLDSVMKQDGRNSPNSGARPSSVMNLVAVICINDFHFVTFVKCGSGPLSHWVLFDSNPSEERPKAEIVPNMGEWLESLEHQCLTNPPEVASKSKLPPMVQRLLSDIYVCIYCPAHAM